MPAEQRNPGDLESSRAVPGVRPSAGGKLDLGYAHQPARSVGRARSPDADGWSRHAAPPSHLDLVRSMLRDLRTTGSRRGIDSSQSR